MAEAAGSARPPPLRACSLLLRQLLGALGGAPLSLRRAWDALDRLCGREPQPVLVHAEMEAGAQGDEDSDDDSDDDSNDGSDNHNTDAAAATAAAASTASPSDVAGSAAAGSPAIPPIASVLPRAQLQRVLHVALRLLRSGAGDDTALTVLPAVTACLAAAGEAGVVAETVSALLDRCDAPSGCRCSHTSLTPRVGAAWGPRCPAARQLPTQPCVAWWKRSARCRQRATSSGRRPRWAQCCWLAPAPPGGSRSCLPSLAA